MKASVQYNDFIGTVAADASDHISLKTYLEQQGVNTDRFEPIGAEFFRGERLFQGSIICVDHDSGDQNTAVKISLEEGISESEFFSLFKRFNVVMTRKYGNFQDLDLQDESIRINRN